MIGGVLLAAAPAAADVTVQAESMSRPTGTSVFYASTASAGKALLLSSTATATKQITTTSSTGRITARAYGNQCAGPPRMTVKVDGRDALVSFVPATGWRDYVADVSVPAGTHSLALTYTNDDATASCNRNLRVDTIKLIGAANVTAPFRRPPVLGAAVRWLGLSGTDARYSRTVVGNFDSITPENEMKMRALEPQRDVFQFGVADQLVAWAEANGKAIRGHTLLWTPALPSWVKNGTWTRDTLLAMLERYVKTVVRRYRGRVGAWDVVNEAIAADGSYERNLYYDKIGPEYVEYAFRWAHEADPQAKLFYNDYSAEGRNPKSDSIYAVLRDLKARGVPVHGFGMQAHTGNPIAASGSDLAANMKRFADLGLQVELTEMDVWTGSDGTTQQKLANQAAVYRTYARACRQLASCGRLTVWGVPDSQSWLGSTQMPLLFDTAYHGKPAFAAVGEELASSATP